MTTPNTPDSNEAPAFDHHPTCSRRGGTSCSCRASVFAVAGDAVHPLTKAISAQSPHEFEGGSKSLPCSRCDLIYSASIHHTAAASSPAPVSPQQVNTDFPCDDYCAGGDCRACTGVNCTCECHASRSAPQQEGKQEKEFDLDPLEFWCDLAEVLGHPRPTKVNPASLVAEVNERLAATPPITPSAAAMRAAKDVVNEILNVPRFVRNPEDTIIEIENKMAAIITRRLAATPNSDAETLVKQWIATLQDGSRVTDEDAEDLMFRIIAFKSAATTPSPETAVGGEAKKCVKCGHRATVNGICQVGTGEPHSVTGYKAICGCKCEFAVPVPAAGDDERPRFTGRATSLNLQGRCDHDEVLTASCEQCARSGNES